MVDGVFWKKTILFDNNLGADSLTVAFDCTVPTYQLSWLFIVRRFLAMVFISYCLEDIYVGNYLNEEFFKIVEIKNN